MKTLLILLAACLFAAPVFAQQIGGKIPTEFIVSGTTSLTGTAGTIVPIYTLPANAGSYVLTRCDVATTAASGGTAGATVAIVCTSGTLSTTGTTSFSSNTYATVPVLNPGTIVVTGTTGQTLTMKILTSGTASILNGEVTLKGYYLP